MPKGFQIQNIKLVNFRNYQNIRREFNSGINKIVGPNATGKSNLLEAIGLLTQLGSFRHAQLHELIDINSAEDFALISAEIFDNELDTINTIKLKISNAKKEYSLNGKNKKVLDLKFKFPSVIFTPDDLMIVKGPSTGRRDAIDNIGCQISKEYYQVLHDYKKALKQKSAVLINNPQVDLIKSINDVVLQSGSQLIYFRAALIEKINKILNDFYNDISLNNEDLKIKYYAF